MEKRRLVFMVLAATLVCAGAASVGAQTASPSPPAPKPFSFGDLMNTLVQPRHVKLALAGQEKNWVLAAYAHHQLKDALGNVAISKPRFRNQAIPELMETMTGEPMRALDQAIKAGDAARFSEAFDRLTKGCNACHTALGHSFVVIKTPDASIFPNQVFRAQP